MKTKEDYINSLKKRKLNAYLFGERIENTVTNPVIEPSLNSMAMTYSLAEEEEHVELMCATSNLTGKIINRFTHLHQNTDDLVKKVKMQRLIGRKTASCFQRCVGLDAANAVYSTTYDIDKKYKTNYHKRFIKYWTRVQELDLAVAGSMTDPKGDRSLSPSQQKDPDLFLHVIEYKKDGVIVKGAKVHQTGVLNCHEILVMPTMRMKEGEEEYSISFGLPTDTDGLTIIYGRQSSDKRKLEEFTDIDLGNKQFGGHEALIVFDHVFVPNERIFLNGEYDFTGILIERFAGYHRQGYGGCKSGVGDVLIGASSVAADYNGTSKASHIKDKLIEMIQLNETLYSCGIASSCEGKKTEAGNYQIDMLLANVCKQNVTRFPYEIARLAQDIAGGLIATMPSEADYQNPGTKEYIEKYLCGVDGIPTEDRMKIFRLIENLTLGTAAVSYLTESLHGAGSPQAQRIMIAREGNLEEKKSYAKAISRIVEIE